MRLLAARGHAVAFTTDRPASDEVPAGHGAPGVPRGLIWNRRSPVSARTVMVSMQNSFATFDEALILEPACPVTGPLDHIGSVDIERAFDESKGIAFLTREVLASFQGRGGGVLCFVSSVAPTGPVESAVHEAFRGLAAFLLAAPGSAAIVANGFQCGAVEPEECAAFIDRTLEEKARKITGRWFSYPARGGFLQGVFKTS